MANKTTKKSPYRLTLLQKLENERIKFGLPSRSAAARNWLVEKIKDLGRNRLKPGLIMNDPTRQNKLFTPGKMYFFYYDPKYKQTLPYYDRFPLVIPIHFYDDGFLGLNLHYLDPRTRAIFLDRLSAFTNNTRFNDSTRLKITYDYLVSSAQLEYFRPCIKKYLFDHCRSKFIYIGAQEWDYAIFLPFERFIKASKEKVWHDSEQMVKNQVKVVPYKETNEVPYVKETK